MTLPDEWDLRPKYRFGFLYKPFMFLLISALICVVVLAFIMIVNNGCTAPDESAEALHRAGYTDIEVGGRSWFECGRDDTYATKFTATNSNGVRVSGTVCCGLVAKGCTIRF